MASLIKAPPPRSLLLTFVGRMAVVLLLCLVESLYLNASTEGAASRLSIEASAEGA